MKHPILQHCRFHAERTTRWYCDSCRLPLCTDCKPFAEKLPIETTCPLCGHALRDVEPRPAGFVGPGGLLATPSNPLALALVVLVTAVVAWVPWPLPGVLTAMPVAVLFLAYLTTVARSAAEGEEQLPAPRQLRDIDHLEYCFQTLAFGLPFIALLLAAVATDSLVLLALSITATGLLLPAVLMATIIGGSALAGFSPGRIRHVIQILGRHYARLAATTLIPLATLALIAVSLSGILPIMLLATIVTGASAWLIIAWGRHIGQELYGNRRRLDYAAGVAPIDRPRRPEPEVYEPAQLVADADALLSEGRKRDARLHLGQALTRYPDDLELNRRFDRLVREETSAKEFANHLERRMQRLVKTGQVAAATDLWQRNSPALSNWLPRITETRYRLALELDERGEHQLAFRLLISLPRDDRKTQRVAHAWMEAARILEDHLDDPDRARELRRIAAQKRRSTGPNRDPARDRSSGKAGQAATRTSSRTESHGGLQPDPSAG